MSEFNIQRWGSWLSGTDNTPLPIIYIKPDLEFLSFAKNNAYNVEVTIQGTDSIYDDKKVRGVVSTSGTIPNCRPNFFSETGWYVIVLDAPFIMDPKMKNGKAIISGMTGPEPVPLPEEVVKAVRATQSSPSTASGKKKPKGLNSDQIIAVSMGALAIILILVIIGIWSKSHKK